MTRGKRTMRAVAGAVALVVAVGGTALASRQDSPRRLAVGRADTPSTTETTDEPTTSTAPPESALPSTAATRSTARPAAPRTTSAARPPTTARRAAPAPAPPPNPAGITAAFYYGWYPSSF